MASQFDSITLDFRRIWQLTLPRVENEVDGWLVCSIGGGAGNSASPFFMSDDDASNEAVHLTYATSLPTGAPEPGTIVQMNWAFGGIEYSGPNKYQPAEWIGRIFTYVISAFGTPYAVLENVNTGEWIIALVEEFSVVSAPFAPPTEASAAIASAVAAVAAPLTKTSARALPQFGPRGKKKP
jgi:hypothetical protein